MNSRCGFGWLAYLYAHANGQRSLEQHETLLPSSREREEQKEEEEGSMRFFFSPLPPPHHCFGLLLSKRCSLDFFLIEGGLYSETAM